MVTLKLKFTLMCYHLSSKSSKSILEARFAAKLTEETELKTYHHVSGFAHPALPIIRSENTTRIERCTWGLIPFWFAGREQAAQIMNNTLNAKAETLYEKPSFKHSVPKNRCIILVDGFYEWKDVNK